MRALLLALALGALFALGACNTATQNAADNPADTPDGNTNDVVVQGASGTAATIQMVGTARLHASPAAVTFGVQDPEFSPAQLGEGDAGADAGLDVVSAQSAMRAQLAQRYGSFVNRRLPKTSGSVAVPSVDATVTPQGLSMPEPTLTSSWHGLDHFDQRYANGGNQFSTEPPDQALCGGNGYMLEVVNVVLQVFDADGGAVSEPVDLNTFFGYPAAIDRTTGTYGPNLFDPICAYDRETNRFFVVIDTLGTDPATGDLTGDAYLDIAVSQSANPLGDWNVYRLDVTNDGADCPCFGDYPHIGIDDNGVYLSTNNFPVFANGFNSAWIYALSKDQLVDGADNVNVVSFQTADPEGNPSYVVWPASVPTTHFETRGYGTEYFMSVANIFSRTSDRIIVWALSNTRSLRSANPAPVLTSTFVQTNPYGDPTPVPQKAGPTPLAYALMDDLFGYGPPPDSQVLGPIDASDARMQQVYFADGRLWGAHATALNMGGEEQAGVAYYIVNPKITESGVQAGLQTDGYIAVADNNVIYPAVAVKDNGYGVIGMTLVGPDHFPSAAYAAIHQDWGAGPVRVAAEGVGPQDGFSEYWLGGGRPRWGDYGAATVAMGGIYVANEYIGQSCTYLEFVQDTTCGGTRSALANWGTRISRLDY